MFKNELEMLNDEIGLDSDPINDQSWYHFSGGCYCGVVVPRDVMIKMAKVLNENSIKIRQILNDNIDRLHSYNWGLIYDQDNTQHTFHYVYDNKHSIYSDLSNRIRLSTLNPTIQKIDHLFTTYDYESKKTDLYPKVGKHYGFTSWSSNRDDRT